MFEPADHDTASIKATLFQCFHSSHLNLSQPTLSPHISFNVSPPFHFQSSPPTQHRSLPFTYTLRLNFGGLVIHKIHTNATNVPSQDSYWELRTNAKIQGKVSFSRWWLHHQMTKFFSLFMAVNHRMLLKASLFLESYLATYVGLS